MDATTTLFQRHGWDIHALCAAGMAGAGRDQEPPQPQRSLHERPGPRAGVKAGDLPVRWLNAGLVQLDASESDESGVRQPLRYDWVTRNRRSRPVIRMILTSDWLGEASRNGQPFCSA